jgi:transposase
LIDSTGLPNAIKCPYTAVNNHNGKISNEIRLISVIDKLTGFPIYYRFVPGNIVDVSTLKNILLEMKEYNINIDRLILDAGYYSDDNIIELYQSKIPFMTRLIPKYSIYNLLIKKYAPNIIERANYVEYGTRHLYIIKDSVMVARDQIPVYAYICCDTDKKNNDYNEYIKNNNMNDISDEKFNNDMLKMGIFIIISTFDLETNEVLPCYYTRQAVEQFFDYLKNDIDLLPLRTHSENTFSGHLMLCFIATIVYLSIDNSLKEKGLSFYSSLKSLKLFNGRVYNDKIIPSVPTKQVNSILRALKIKLEDKINI